MLYWAEGNYVDAAISFACGIPAVGNIIAGVAKASKVVKAIKTAEKIAGACRAVGKIGNTASAIKTVYDTYQTAQRECKTTTGKIAYMAGTLAAGYLMGKVANWGAGKIKNFASKAADWGAGKIKNLVSKAMPKLKTTLKENAGKLANKVSNMFSGFGGKGDKGADLVSYYEYKALKQQGYSASEAYDLMKQFRSGDNPNNDFAFHFTTLEGGKGITDSRQIIGSKTGVRGAGVYAGRTPTPSWALKHIPWSGWGLGSTPVRIPIKIESYMNARELNYPLQSMIFDCKILEY